MSKLRKLGLQFFADGGEGGNDDSGQQQGQGQGQQQQGQGDPGQQQNQQQQQAKTFTQEDVNRMLANEKRQGRQSVLKALGLDPNDKDAEKKAKAILDGQKSQAERDADALKAAQTAQAEATTKAIAAERKLAVLMSGCKSEYIDEVTALAAAKVNDTTDFEAALKVVKEKCAAFFADEGDNGTGGGQGHRRKGSNDKPGSLGARLAQGSASNNFKNSPYFKN